MEVSRIDILHHFDQLRANWEAVYTADPDAHIFVSWVWLRGWLDITPFEWFVLAARPVETSPYVAFLTLSMRSLQAGKLNLIRALRMDSKPLGGCTGLVCLPEYEQEAMAAFARYIQQELSWDNFRLEHVLDPRLELLLDCFPREQFDVRETGRSPSTYIPLPNTWDMYLQDSLGRETRQTLRRRIRCIERDHEFRITNAQEDNLTHQIETALVLNELRWGPRSQQLRNWTISSLQHCFRHNNLWLGLLWDGSTPMSALVALTDQIKKTFYLFIITYNAKYATLSPGKVMLGYSIKYAIENGYQVYDFLRGGDDYKFRLGARKRADAVTTVVARKSLRNLAATVGLNLATRLRDLPKRGRR